jgi:hypothetical protein
MSEIIIQKEGLATRCEICHQDDCFDAIRNFCFRCEALINPQVKPKKISSSVLEREQKTRLLIKEISRDLAQKATPRTTKKKKAVKPNFIGFCVATTKILQNPPKKKQRSRSLERCGNYGVIKRKPKNLKLARSIGAIVFLLAALAIATSIFYFVQ